MRGSKRARDQPHTQPNPDSAIGAVGAPATHLTRAVELAQSGMATLIYHVDSKIAPNSWNGTKRL